MLQLIRDVTENECRRSPYILRMSTFALSFLLHSNKLKAYICQKPPGNGILFGDVLSATLDFHHNLSECNNKADIQTNVDVRIKFSVSFRNCTRVFVKTTRWIQMVDPPLKSRLLGAYGALGPMRNAQRSTKIWPFSYLNRAVCLQKRVAPFAFVMTFQFLLPHSD